MADVNTSGSTPAGTNNPVQQNPAPAQLGQPTNAAMNNFPADAPSPEQLEQLAQQIPNGNANQKSEAWSTRASRAGVSLAELAAALPLIPSSLVSQAENIIDHEESELGSFWLNYVTTTIKTLSSFFIYPFRKFIAPRQQDDIDYVAMNKRPFLLDDIIQRSSQTAVVRQVTSFIFAMRRSLSNFLPNLFTVPAEEHDPLRPQGKRVSGFIKNLYTLGDTLVSPFRFVSSMMSVLISLPSHALGIASSYLGDQKSFNFAKFGEEISEIMMPVVSNFDSLQRIARAYFDSWTTGNSKRVELDKYNVGFTHMIQATLGSVTAVPYFISAFAKVKDKLLEKVAGESKLAIVVREFVSSFSLLLKSLGFYTGNTASLQYNAKMAAEKFCEYVSEYSDKYLGKLMNSNSYLQSLFKKIRPTNLDGEVIPSMDLTKGNMDIQDGYVLNRFRKSSLFSDLYDYLHPIQRSLMLLPNAFVNLSDPYVQDNGTRLLRWADRLVGLNSMILSFPNAVIYFAKTRAPQLILKFYETKQKKMELEGHNYDSYTAFRNLVAHLGESHVPGAGYVAASLENLDIRPGDFKNPEAIKGKLDKIEDDAKEQEHALKASELVKAMRIGLRHLIASENPVFFARRNEEGYTAEEQNKMKIYDAIGNFATTIRGIPVLGWFGAPLIEMFRSVYKVKRKDNLKLLGARPGAKEVEPNLATAQA
ncbi:MAG: hypothetical protein OXU45_07165 [Candidatus Melainabacteria bacterium]|nr:hypothetical protein [Candidatus Melainabacteria bacterium]